MARPPAIERPVSFRADRPVLFLIVGREPMPAVIPLFIGRLANPAA
jgi:hypothetical protein